MWGGPGMGSELVSEGGMRSGQTQTAALLKKSHTFVTAVTEPSLDMEDTRVVIMVRRASKKAHLEPGDTRQPWKGEAAARFVYTGIISSRVLPTSSAGYWSPSLSCD
jgi:hypothetical protein